MKKEIGFRLMSVEKRKEIAGMGGKSAHQQKRAHEFTSDEAREAGKKGGRPRKIVNVDNTNNEQGRNDNGTSTSIIQ